MGRFVQGLPEAVSGISKETKKAGLRNAGRPFLDIGIPEQSAQQGKPQACHQRERDLGMIFFLDHPSDKRHCAPPMTIT
jgi:hypothetical protein